MSESRKNSDVDVYSNVLEHLRAVRQARAQVALILNKQQQTFHCSTAHEAGLLIDDASQAPRRTGDVTLLLSDIVWAVERLPKVCSTLLLDKQGCDTLQGDIGEAVKEAVKLRETFEATINSSNRLRQLLEIAAEEAESELSKARARELRLQRPIDYGGLVQDEILVVENG